MMNSVWSFATDWYNAPFSILFVLCLLMSVAQWVGLGVDAEHDADGLILISTAAWRLQLKRFTSAEYNSRPNDTDNLISASA